MKNWNLKNGGYIHQVLSGRSNAYLVSTGSHHILIDTGKDSAYGELCKNLAFLKLSVKDISYLFLTHTHYDHCQSVRKIKGSSSCLVIVSENVADIIKSGYTTLPKGTLPLTKLIAKLSQLIGKKMFGYPPFEADIPIKGNYNLEIAATKISIVETTGHSNDSISLVVDNEIALVGDAMIGDTLIGILRKPVFPPFADNVETVVKSWGKLLNTPCSIFLPGHGKQISRELLQKSYDKYKKLHLSV